MIGRSPKAGAQEARDAPELPAAQRGEETRRRLSAAAVALVQEVGWGSVSTRAIAQRAGLPPGLVHYHFRSVTDLLVDATVPVLAQMVEDLAELTDAAPDLPSGADALLAAVAGYAADAPASRLAAEAFLAADRVPRLRTELAGLLARARRILAGWLRRHGYPGDVEPAAAALVALIDGLVLHLAVDPRLDPASLAGPVRALVGGPAAGTAGPAAESAGPARGTEGS